MDDAVKKAFDAKKGRSGSPGLTLDLADAGQQYDRKTVAESMRRQGLRAKAARKFKATTNSKHGLPVAPNLLQQDFTATAPNQKYVSDITYLWTDEGWLYPDGIKLREVKVGNKVLVSTLLSTRRMPKAVLGELFSRRWNEELDLRNFKTTLGMEAFSCKTPQMCEKKLWAYLLAYNLIRLMMAAAALQAGVLPRQ